MHRGDCENLFEPWSARNERKRRIRGNKSTLLKYVGSPGSNGSKGENREEKRRKFVEGKERHFLTSRVETDEWGLVTNGRYSRARSKNLVNKTVAPPVYSASWLNFHLFHASSPRSRPSLTLLLLHFRNTRCLHWVS